jgi:hypothetical protein
MTGHRQNIPFTEDAYEDIYRNHIATLEEVRTSAPKSMHRILQSRVSVRLRTSIVLLILVQ